jgi:hypothetical protein
MPAMYNATNGRINGLNMPLARLLPFSDIKGDEVLDLSGPVPTLQADIDDFILRLPDVATALDIEPSTSPHLDYAQHPDTAVSIRKELAARVKQVRPELDVGFYVLPEYGRRSVLDPDKNAVDEMRREVAFREVSPLLTNLYITGYWKAGSSEVSYLPTWRAMMDLQVAYSTAIHHNPCPRVFIWDNARNWGSVNYEIMTAMLKYCRIRELPVVAWSLASSARPLPWWIMLAYWQHSVL